MIAKLATGKSLDVHLSFSEAGVDIWGEYSKPLTQLRQKELALNYVCSMILPIDQRTKRY